ncbi:hypothetical protein G7046_g9290 [Stylonectria norvegica]|nr:hypothetical protein G7046_g9290 [Stylonectria norvegica]
MSWFTTLTGYVAPFFLIMSPIISYSDQAVAMQRSKTSAGFSLDIPLIMLVASFLRIFYWPYEQYDLALLVQSLIMVVMQVILLKIALDHRPPPSTKGGEAGLPFAGAANDGIWGAQRPYNFWQWRSPKPYWQCILYFAGGLVVCEVIFARFPGLYAIYSGIIGPLGLAVEATLPIPQIMANSRSKSCKGFRLSLLASWLGGDSMKLYWFFTSSTEIPLAFKVSGCFQASCDALLGIQYWMYGNGETEEVKDHAMSEWSVPPKPLGRRSGSLTPTRRSAPFSDTEVE